MLTYGIDWDDVISDLNTHAIQLANGEHGLDLKLEDINSWENVGKASVIKQYYQDERIYRMQPEISYMNCRKRGKYILSQQSLHSL